MHFEAVPVSDHSYRFVLNSLVSRHADCPHGRLVDQTTPVVVLPLGALGQVDLWVGGGEV
jgi:hypothetical protein